MVEMSRIQSCEQVQSQSMPRTLCSPFMFGRKANPSRTVDSDETKETEKSPEDAIVAILEMQTLVAICDQEKRFYTAGVTTEASQDYA